MYTYIEQFQLFHSDSNQVKLNMTRSSSVFAFVLSILFAIAIEYASYGAALFPNCSEIELEALTDFKTGLADPENRLLSWEGRNCCQWHGIGCNNRTGAVVTIDLHNPYPIGSDASVRYGFWNLSGEVRPSLMKLKSLQYLDLSLNTFNDIPIPDFLGSLQNLQYLNLSNSGFSGALPSNLGNLSRLQYLDVSTELSSGLTADSLEWVTSLVSLKHLAMDHVDLSLVGSDWVVVLNNIPNLTELHLSSCDLNGAIPSTKPVNLTSLAVLDLSFNNDLNSKIPDWLVNVSTLVFVELSFCNFYGRIPLGFGELPNLQHLSVSGNNNLSASCSQLFQGSWRKIQVLDFASNKLHGKLPSSIGNMTFLTSFDLFSNNVEGGIPSSIGRLCNLKNFDISGNNLTGSLPEFLEGTNHCVSGSPLPSLVYLRLSNNRLVGTLPEWLGQLENFVELSLGYNLLQGPIPASLGRLQNLDIMSLQGNQLNGTLPESFGQLSELSSLDVSSNHLTGIISELHFSRLSKLKSLRLSSNSFILNVSSNWIPPFQALNLEMRSCHLGPLFPSWLGTQKELKTLDFSNASVSGYIASWFWDISANLSLLNVSFNDLQGQLPNPLNIAPFADVDFSSNRFEGPICLPIVEIELLDLSNNHFSGSMPQNISESMPNLIFLSVSGNQLTGDIPASIGDMLSLQVIDLSKNNFTGSIPSSIGNCSFLKALDLGYNNLTGEIPASLGRLQQLRSLHLSNNKLTGTLPSSFQNLLSLETLDLGHNRFSGNIPVWIGDGFANLRIFSLPSNALSGEIPASLSNLKSLQVLDLAENNLTGSIPGSLADLKAMAREQNALNYLLYGKYRGLYYEESLVVNIKGHARSYTKTLSLVTNIDLSGNNLSGEFPARLTKLPGLVILNLSRNHIRGRIPENISSMHQLSSLDLSSNNLSDQIPSSLSSLSFLAYLNLSNNNFWGAIPFTAQMTTFDASSFAGNPGLCGDPLPVKCQDEGSDEGGSGVDADTGDAFVDKWFYMSLGLGFAAGLLVPILILAIRKSWSDAYFGLVDKLVDRWLWVQKKRRPGSQRNQPVQ